jgi:hypothetical protein
MANRLLVALLVYVMIIAVLLIVKPASLFMANGEAKRWGVENSETTSVFAPAISFPVLAILCYYGAVWYEAVI